jgi:hypothetical protein
MYEIRDFNDGGMLLDYLNNLGNHELVYCSLQGNIWMVMIKKTRMGRPPKTETPEPKVEEEVKLEPTAEVGSILSDYASGFGRKDG